MIAEETVHWYRVNSVVAEIKKGRVSIWWKWDECKKGAANPPKKDQMRKNGRVGAAKIRMTGASPPRPTGVVVWTLKLRGEKVERQESSEANPPVRWGAC